MIQIRLALAAIAIALTGAAALAQTAAAPPPMLNEPTAGWNVFGPGQTHKARKDAAVQGGIAMRVTIASKPANPWDIGASVPVQKGVAKGDKLILAFWARIADAGDGRADVGATIQQNSAPYAPIVAGRVELTSEWKLVHIKGIAAADYTAGQVNAALTLGDGARTIDLGPAFVMKSE
ncbi:hypothetical protein [Sphingomonas sp. LT1P40]|uniref:hypothetical protein n=1 Tax=Alteristakelama amylovorans TaxID=3096166 RepID=UPI002FC9A1B2